MEDPNHNIYVGVSMRFMDEPKAVYDVIPKSSYLIIRRDILNGQGYALTEIQLVKPKLKN